MQGKQRTADANSKFECKEIDSPCASYIAGLGGDREGNMVRFAVEGLKLVREAILRGEKL